MPPSLPSVPELENDDSMLTRRFGKEVVNYYAGSSLNRFSFLRADGPFLRRAAAAPLARYVALSDLNPLTVESGTRLARFTLRDVSPLIGEEPFVLGEEESVKQWDSTKKTPLVVFLGMTQDPSGKESGSVESSDHGKIEGSPLFVVDVTARPPYVKEAGEFLKNHIKGGGQLQANPRSMTLEADDASIFAQSRSIVDWNLRIPFCAGCGHPTLSVHAGYKRVCPPTDLRGTSSAIELPSCPSRKGITNIAFPRTDPTMIAAIVSADGTRLLLGRQKSWPDCMYSTLAGFLEPGESIEEAVRREAWEESGVKVGRVVVHSSQPWPYPASLMIGAIAQTLPGAGEKIQLNDKELDNAKWFDFDEVRTALETSAGALHLPPPEGYKEGTLRLPPHQAIANRLITAVVNGFLSGTPKM